MTNGTVIEISLTGALHLLTVDADLTRLGTAILVKPGIISGGPVVHECPLSRSIGYFLEPIIMLAPFSKKPLGLTLRGITTDDKDLSVCLPQTSRWILLIISRQVDLIRTVTLPHLEPFGITDGLELKVCEPFAYARVMLMRVRRSRNGVHLRWVEARFYFSVPSSSKSKPSILSNLEKSSASEVSRTLPPS